MRSLRVVTSRWFVLALAAGILVAGLTVSMIGRARAASYSRASLTGTYIFRGSGIGLFAAPKQTSAAPGFAAGFGTVTYDGAGHFTGTQTVSSTPMQEVPSPGPRPATGKEANAVQITCTYKLAGTYEVSADGDYSSSFSATPTKENCVGANFTASGVMGSGGKVIYGVTTGVTMADSSHGVFASNVTEFELNKQ